MSQPRFEPNNSRIKVDTVTANHPALIADVSSLSSVKLFMEVVATFCLLLLGWKCKQRKQTSSQLPEYTESHPIEYHCLVTTLKTSNLVQF
jgi:hypothetical protein